MLSLADTILLSIALAMDCFAVSIVSGILLRRIVWRVLIQMSVLFGIFQALMPLLGWTVAESFAHHVNTWGHWIAFALLLLIGLNMIRESRLPEEEHHFNPTRLTTQLMLSVATSIDAKPVSSSSRSSSSAWARCSSPWQASYWASASANSSTAA